MLLSLRLGKNKTLQLAAANNPPLISGQTNDGVAAVQDLLRDIGFAFPVSFNDGKADGIFGTETKANVEAFQKSAGLKPDGMVGRMTLAALDEMVIKNNILEEHTDTEVELSEVVNRTFPKNLRTRYAT